MKNHVIRGAYSDYIKKIVLDRQIHVPLSNILVRGPLLVWFLTKKLVMGPLCIKQTQKWKLNRHIAIVMTHYLKIFGKKNELSIFFFLFTISNRERCRNNKVQEIAKFAQNGDEFSSMEYNG